MLWRASPFTPQAAAAASMRAASAAGQLTVTQNGPSFAGGVRVWGLQARRRRRRPTRSPRCARDRRPTSRSPRRSATERRLRRRQPRRVRRDVGMELVRAEEVPDQVGGGDGERRVADGRLDRARELAAGPRMAAVLDAVELDLGRFRAVVGELRDVHHGVAGHRARWSASRRSRCVAAHAATFPGIDVYPTQLSTVPWIVSAGTGRAGAQPDGHVDPRDRRDGRDAIGIGADDRRGQEGTEREAVDIDAIRVDAQCGFDLVEQLSEVRDVGRRRPRGSRSSRSLGDRRRRCRRVPRAVPSRCSAPGARRLAPDRGGR